MDLQPNKTDAIIKPITNTRISASEWNQLVGSCMAFITEAGLTPDASDNEQFLNAFKTIAAGLEIVGANTNLSNVTNTGTSTAAGWAMPSGTYTDLTLGASGSAYTAPANGYYCIAKMASAAGQYWFWQNATASEIRYSISVHNDNQTVEAFIFARKGDTIKVGYNLGGATTFFRFIYAEGSKSEAN